MQRKHMLLEPKAKHSSTSQVKIGGYIKSSKDSSTVRDAEMRKSDNG